MNKKLIIVFSFYLFVALGNKKIKISQGGEEWSLRNDEETSAFEMVPSNDLTITKNDS
jgi:hypothetical protein